MNVWYRVSDLDAACDFYVTTLGFELSSATTSTGGPGSPRAAPS